MQQTEQRPEKLADRGVSVVLDRSHSTRLDAAIERARDKLTELQHPDGYWCFELEADATISAEYVLMMHFMDEIDASLQQKIASYLRARQGPDGGWPLYFGGETDLSCTVKVYWALKLAGDLPSEPHMTRAREAILARGGAACCNVFTRIAMALFGEVPWRATPFLPVEIALLPRWFPFHISKISYWSRTVMVPLSILCSLKARAANPTGRNIRELFATPPERERGYFRVRSPLNRLMLSIERVARVCEPAIPSFVRRRALRRAETWILERLNGEDGLGGIFPAMVNAYEALSLLGYDESDARRIDARAALRKLLVLREEEAYCQPCLSPIWDTALASLALQETADRNGESDERLAEALRRAHVWLARRQVLRGPADWRTSRPELQPGGFAFQFNNPHYPDLDDTSIVAWALHQGGGERFQASVQRAADWIAGMQSQGGGFASFDVDNTYEYLSHIPFADHGALLDPPTADVTARCALVLALLGGTYSDRLKSALDYIEREQEQDGSWYGRWGTNYIYGTWSVLVSLELALSKEGARGDPQCVQRAVEWLKSVQRPDGSWGEDCDSYARPEEAGRGREGTSFQTSWGVLALMAAGEGPSKEVRRGIDYLLHAQDAEGSWNDAWFTAPGFPRVFYLRYHGYRCYFPLWALARYRNELHARRGGAV